jgi:hypothetical protein
MKYENYLLHIVAWGALAQKFESVLNIVCLHIFCSRTTVNIQKLHSIQNFSCNVTAFQIPSISLNLSVIQFFLTQHWHKKPHILASYYWLMLAYMLPCTMMFVIYLIPPFKRKIHTSNLEILFCIPYQNFTVQYVQV